MTRSLPRLLAIAIGAAGVLNPAITSLRRTKPEIAFVSTAAPEDAPLVERARRLLASRFSVVEGPFAGAAATVAVGEQLAPHATELAAPAFVVLPEPRTPRVAIEAVRASARASLNARLPVAVTVRARQARGRSVVVTLRQADVAIDRVTRPVTTDDEQLAVDLAFVPHAAGTAALGVTAEIDVAPRAARVDLAVHVVTARWAVLVFDRRPSWMSTFVRRAIEADPRFVVTSRVITSRNASADAGDPPAGLDELPSLALFDAVVAGAPDALTARDVEGLDALMRRHGGTVVLLMDEASQRRPFERFFGPARWAEAVRAEPLVIPATTEDGGALRASELAWPDPLPVAAVSLAADASADASRAVEPAAASAVWRVPVGAGRLIVSGALDAWRYRDEGVDAFDRYWRHAIASSVDVAPAPAELARDAADLPKRSGDRMLALATPDERGWLAAWTASRAGRVIPESELPDLVPALELALQPASRRETWYPMRSAWWMAPFALALGVEWRARRRRGQR